MVLRRMWQTVDVESCCSWHFQTYLRRRVLAWDRQLGDGYDATGAASSPNPYADDSYYARYSGQSHMPSPYSPLPTPSPSHIDTNVAAAPSPVSATSRGPRSPHSPAPGPSHQSPMEPVYEDQPPVYDVATAQPPGQYDTKH